MKINALPSPTRGQTLLLIAPDSTATTLFEMVARLALQGPLYVLDGGNTFQGYTLARSLARYGANVEETMQRILLSRAFTCYQMATLLTEEAFAPYPILILDFLATFYDQGVRVAERQRLLQICLRQMDRLSRSAPLALWVRQRRVIPQEGLGFLSMVEAAAGRVWRPEKPLPVSPVQPALLPGL